ncbi:MAG: NAD-dependent epimerase/dehydratase family protein [Alphaproteobacteria bacterium]|nr:NAD-dependent epimerase/dehydratase family protein [Alphaproteobacteria bacterium]
MTILVTGASGFLGRRLAEMLSERGQALRLILRSSSNFDATGLERCEVVRCSLADNEALIRAMRGVRLVYNCAGLSSDWGRWADFRAANIDGVANLLGAARHVETVRRFVHVSTTDIYGYPEHPGDERQAFHDVGLPYNRSKGLGDRLVLDFQKTTGLPVTVVRPATIFGPRSKDWVVELSRHLKAGRALTVAGGRSAAGLVYVDDVAHAMMDLAAIPAAAGEAYNVVDPHPITWREYFDIVADALDVPRPTLNVSQTTAWALSHICETAYRILGMTSRPLFTRHVVFLLTRNQQYDSGKLTAAVRGFPEVGLLAGLERTMAWLKARYHEMS